MLIYGFQKTTLLDYPGHIAATVFVGGCNFRCPFCHNARLVLGVEEPDVKASTQNVSVAEANSRRTAVLRKSSGCMEEAEVLAYLQKRKGILQGVCITGGEPTLQPDLKKFICRLKDLGYLVKLDTNGYRPEVLRELLESGLLDYVAMDIKACKEKYGKVAGVANFDITGIEESVEILKGSEIPYEFRTTVVKGIHSIVEFEVIGKWLAGCQAYYLQEFRDNEELLGLHNAYVSEKENWDKKDGVGLGKYLQPFTKEEMEQMAELARKYIDKVALRGVE